MVAKKENRCWPGYEPVPGKEPYSKGSCQPQAGKKSATASKKKTAPRKAAAKKSR